MSLWVDVFLSGWVGELMSSGVAGHLCIGKPLSWLVLYSARFVETLKVKATSLKVKATSLYNTRARERWARSLLLSFSAAPFCLISNTIFPYPPRRFTLSPTSFCLIPTSFHLIPHAIFALSPTPFCLISNTILPYPPRRFTLSPKPSFHLFIFSPFHLFTFSPFHPLFNHR